MDSATLRVEYAGAMGERRCGNPLLIHQLMGHGINNADEQNITPTTTSIRNSKHGVRRPKAGAHRVWRRRACAPLPGVGGDWCELLLVCIVSPMAHELVNEQRIPTPPLSHGAGVLDAWCCFIHYTNRSFIKVLEP